MPQKAKQLLCKYLLYGIRLKVNKAIFVRNVKTHIHLFDVLVCMHPYVHLGPNPPWNGFILDRKEYPLAAIVSMLKIKHTASDDQVKSWHGL